MNIVVVINIFQFIVSSNLLLPYKTILIRLVSLTIEKEMGIFSKSFIKLTRFVLYKEQLRKVLRILIYVHADEKSLNSVLTTFFFKWVINT